MEEKAKLPTLFNKLHLGAIFAYFLLISLSAPVLALEGAYELGTIHK